MLPEREREKAGNLTTDLVKFEAALEQIPGRAIVNSVNLEAGRAKLDRVVPVALAHGAALIALTIDEVGMAKTAERKLELAQRIESGICHINDTTVHDEPQMPFGGVKASGFGRFGGRAALEEFTELRWITVQELPRQYPI